LTSSKRQTLRGVHLLASLDETERAELEAACVWRRYHEGERVFERGSPSGEVYFVIEGALNVVRLTSMGREITFSRVDAGEAVGELGAIDGSPRSASAVTVDETLIAVLPAERFVALLEQRGVVAVRLIQKLSEFVRRGSDRVIELSTFEARSRVYGELLRLARPEAAESELWVIDPLPPLREIAGQASTTREHVANALNHLYPSGLIRRRGNRLYITDRAALEAIVHQTREPTQQADEAARPS
jgi:CRP/FNR family transcriptional regulator, cyclic AMP receptor protein